MVMVFRCSDLSAGSKATVEESNSAPFTAPSLAVNVGGCNCPPHCPGVKFADKVDLSPADISAGEADAVPVGGWYAITLTVVSADASLKPGAATLSPM